LILALETATKSCSVALIQEGKLLAARNEFSDDFKHAERLHILVHELLIEANTSLNKLAGIAVSKGPGSYTGLRIGVSSAKGYAFTLGIPLYSFSPLQMLVFQAIEMHTISADQQIIAMIDARRDEVYMQVFNGLGKAVSEVTNHIIDSDFFDKYAGSFLVGDGADKFGSWDCGTCKILAGIKPSAQYLVKDAADITEVDVAYFEPFYLKDFVATTPKKLT